jgi:hypothetical protein
MTRESIVRDVLSRLSAAWQERRWADLESLLDEEVVFVTPGFGTRFRGRAACADSYRQFMQQAALLAYEETDLQVDDFGSTAIATFRWKMRWSSQGTSSDESGHDVFVLREQASVWRVIWRTMIVGAGAPEQS